MHQNVKLFQLLTLTPYDFTKHRLPPQRNCVTWLLSEDIPANGTVTITNWIHNHLTPTSQQTLIFNDKEYPVINRTYLPNNGGPHGLWNITTKDNQDLPPIDHTDKTLRKPQNTNQQTYQ